MAECRIKALGDSHTKLPGWEISRMGSSSAQVRLNSLGVRRGPVRSFTLPEKFGQAVQSLRFDPKQFVAVLLSHLGTMGLGELDHIGGAARTLASLLAPQGNECNISVGSQ